MDNFQELEGRIIKLRNRMHSMIEKNPELKNPEILSISQELDRLLNIYEEIKKKL